MSISIKFNADGSITVECGDESVVVAPGGQSVSSIKKQTHIEVTTAPPPSPAEPKQPRKKPGAPPIPPSVMVALGGTTLKRRIGATIEVPLGRDRKIDLKTLTDQLRIAGARHANLLFDAGQKTKA